MALNLLKLAEEYKRLDKRRKLLKGKLPAAQEKRYNKLQRILAQRLNGESPSDRRKELRVPTAIRVRYPAEKTFVNNYIHNLSKGGVFVSTPKPLPLNTKLKLKLSFQDVEKEVEIEGKVVWENTQEQAHSDITRPGMGIKFTKLSDEAQTLVDDLIHDHITEHVRMEEKHEKEIENLALDGTEKNKNRKK